MSRGKGEDDSLEVDSGGRRTAEQSRMENFVRKKNIGGGSHHNAATRKKKLERAVVGSRGGVSRGEKSLPRNKLGIEELGCRHSHP